MVVNPSKIGSIAVLASVLPTLSILYNLFLIR